MEKEELQNTSPFWKALHEPKTTPTNKINISQNTTHYNTGIGNSKYDKRFVWGVDTGDNDVQTNIEDYRSKNQPWVNKVGAGLARVGLKVGTELAKMPGFIGGAIVAPFAEEGEGWETFVNNSWVKALNNFNEEINDEYLPVYVKKAVKEGNLIDNVFSLDFWATEGADGIGYIVSMMAPGAILKGLGVGNKLSKIPGLAGKVSGQKLDVISATVANTMFESAAEAGNAMENFEKDLQSKLQSGQISQEQYEEMQLQKARLGRDIFIANTAILLGPNALQANMLWGRSVNKTAAKLFDGEGKLLQNVINPKWYSKVGNRLGDIGKATASEGLWEEGMQMTVENMFTKSAEKGQLKDGFLGIFNDFNLGELSDAYLNTISSTEGQKAMFLGAFLGGGMQAYQGGKQDIKDRKATQSLLDIANTSIDSYNKALTENIYNEDGSINTSKVRSKVAALQNLDTLDELYQNALAKSDFEALEELRDIAGSQLAFGFITNDQLGLEVLRKHLEESSQLDEVLQKEQDLGNKVTKKDIVERVMEKATVMEKAYSNFQKFAPSLYNPTVNNDKLTEEEKQSKVQEFRNILAQNYLTNKVVKDIYDKKIKELEKDRIQILRDLDIQENLQIDDELLTPLQESDERLKKITEDLKDLKEEFQNIDKVDKSFWNKDRIQKDFDKYTKEIEKDEKNSTPEKLEEYESVLNEIKELETEKDVENYKKNLKKEHLSNPVVLEKLSEQLNNIQEALKLKEIAEETTIIEEDENQFELDEVIGTVNTDTDTLSATEISIVTGLETIQTSEKSELEEDNDLNSFLNLKENTNPEHSDENQGAARIISTYKDTNEAIPGLESFVEYEKESRDKTEDKVTFDLGNLTDQKQDQKLKQILDKLKNEKLNDKEIEFLENYLPIKVTLSNGKKSAFSFIDSMSHPNPDIVARETLPLRKAIIASIINNNGSFEGIEGKIDKQFTGTLKIGEQNNTILDLDVFKDMSEKQKIDYFKKNTIYVGNKGEIKYTATGLPIHNFELKAKSKGEVFLLIPMINGKQFPLKLNTNKLSEEKASATLNLIILRSRLLSQKQDMTFEELQDYIDNNELQSIQPEFDFIKRNTDTIDQTLERLINLVVHSQNTNAKTRLELKPNGVLLLGELLHTFNEKLPQFDDKVKHYYYTNDILENLSEVQRQSLIQYLQYKRHNVLITKDDDFTFNNDSYIKYLLGTETGYPILSTNAVTNEPTFQGYSNIYLKQSVTNKSVKKETLSENVKPNNEVENILESLNYGTEISTVKSDIEAKEAEIEKLEKDKQEVLRQNLSKTDFAVSLFPAFSQSNMSQGGGAYVEINFGKNNIFRPDTYLTPSALNKQYPTITDGKATIEGEMTDGTKIALPWNQLKDLLNSIKSVNTKGEVVYEFNKDKINAKYDTQIAQKQAELKALKQSSLINIQPTTVISTNSMLESFNKLSEEQQVDVLMTLSEKLNKPIDSLTGSLSEVFTEMTKGVAENKIKKICAF